MSAKAFEEFKELGKMLNAQFEIDLPDGLVQALDRQIDRLLRQMHTDDDRRLMLKVIYEIVGLLMITLGHDNPDESELTVLSLALYLGRIISNPQLLPLIAEWVYEQDEEIDEEDL